MCIVFLVTFGGISFYSRDCSAALFKVNFVMGECGPKRTPEQLKPKQCYGYGDSSAIRR